MKQEWQLLEIKLRNKQDNYIFTGLQEQQKFFLTREGLFIYYQPYEIAPYSSGIIKVPIVEETEHI